jgi:hypothetical protein
LAAILSLPPGLYRDARLCLGYDDSLSALTEAPGFQFSRIAKKFSSPETMLHAEQITLVQHLKSASRHYTIV